MRRDPTPAEGKLWHKLRNHRFGGLKFRRQMPLGRFIADFYCSSARPVVEVDGASHIDARTDERRDAWMSAQGIQVLRYSNEEVLGDLEGVLTEILQHASRIPPPNPLPQGEGE